MVWPVGRALSSSAAHTWGLVVPNGEGCVVMAISRRSALAVAGVTVGASTLVALLMMPALAGGAPAPAPAAPALAGACNATAHVDNQWYGGEIVTVRSPTRRPRPRRGGR